MEEDYLQTFFARDDFFFEEDDDDEEDESQLEVQKYNYKDYMKKVMGLFPLPEKPAHMCHDAFIKSYLLRLPWRSRSETVNLCSSKMIMQMNFPLRMRT